MERSYKLNGVSVFFAMPARDNIPPETVISLLGTLALLRDKGVPYSVNIQVGGCLCDARSTVAANFLDSDQTRLFFIDTDITWEPDDALKLLALSTEMDIVTGAYTTRADPAGFMIKVKDREAIPINGHGCAAVDGLGLGFCVISRRVIRDLSKNVGSIVYQNAKPIPNVFRFGITDGIFQGEDIAFFSDAKAAGYQCWLDPSITLGHIGKKIYKASLLDHVEQHGNLLRVVGE